MRSLLHHHYQVRKALALAALLGLLLPVLALGVPALAQQPVRIIFLHHSCGQNLIDQGGVREGLTALGYEFYDHGYNGDGLRLADGSYTGTNFDIPDDNTDPNGLAVLFAQPLHDPPDNAFSRLMQYDVIIFKSCFPNSNIGDDEQLAQDKSYYLSIRDRIDQYPDKLFIAVTQPPQVPGSSNRDEAQRARALADWLKSDEFLAGHPNLRTFDFFDQLAGDDNFLRREYRIDNQDAHPNEQANQEIGPRFVDFIDQAMQSFAPAAQRPTAEPLTQPTEAPAVEEATAEPPIAPPVAGLVEDFEAGADAWGPEADGQGSVVECEPDSGTVHDGTASLRMGHLIVAGGWGNCGRYFESPQDWSSGEALSLWLRSDRAGQPVTVILVSGDPDANSPFEVYLDSPAEWTPFTFPWADFVKAPWADAGGLSAIDPARVTGLVFNVGEDPAGQEGTLWVDDIGLAAGGSQPAPASAPAVEATAPAEPTEEPQEESGGGICPFAAILPVGFMAVLLTRRRQNKPV
jgi:Carbohydrate binding domain (family 11)